MHKASKLVKVSDYNFKKSSAAWDLNNIPEAEEMKSAIKWKLKTLILNGDPVISVYISSNNSKYECRQCVTHLSCLQTPAWAWWGPPVGQWCPVYRDQWLHCGLHHSGGSGLWCWLWPCWTWAWSLSELGACPPQSPSSPDRNHMIRLNLIYTSVA